MYPSNSKTIMFVSGAFVSHNYWENWILFFENQGYKVVAPPWIHKNDNAENLRIENSSTKIGSITLNNLLSYYEEIIEILPEKPVLIGHSYGGLLVQLLVQKDLAAAGICINSFPPSGYTAFKFSYLKHIFKFSCNLLSLKMTYNLSFRNWQNIFYNATSNEQQLKTYQKYWIPESKKALRGLFSGKAKINFRKKHAPILLISCSDDQMISPKLVYWNYKKYRNVHAITCYKSFDDQNHFTILHPEWEAPAEHILKWLDKIF